MNTHAQSFVVISSFELQRTVYTHAAGGRVR
eukprot:COSAG06_NODE_59142_length_275_cov_0.585227_2_plen_30_part_01